MKVDRTLVDVDVSVNEVTISFFGGSVRRCSARNRTGSTREKAMRRIVTTVIILIASGDLADCASGGGSPMKPQEVSTASLPAGASAAAQGETPLGRAILKAVNDFRATKGVGALAADT